MERWHSVMDEEADLFEDAISVTSASSAPAWKKGRDYISLSRCTVYHSAQDLQDVVSDDEEKPVMAAIQEPVEAMNNSKNVFDLPEEMDEPSFDIMTEVKSVVHRFLDFVHVDPNIFKPQENRLTAEFSRDKIYLFDVESKNFFTAAIRTTVVDYILERVKFSRDDSAHFAFGVNRLISEGVYCAAYPLHDVNIYHILIIIFCTLFLELWKRYSADITHHWGLTGFDVQAEHPRPEYLARLRDAKRVKINVVTNTKEPYVPFWKVRVPATILSFSVVLLLFYDWVAVKLTEMELLRTQTEFDDSLTLKIYLFQFVNYYTSIFYIAFLKGKFVGYPLKYNRIFGERQEECSPGGCLMELCIQLAIIMVGKQAYNTILEMVIPLLYKWWNTFKIKTGIEQEEAESRIAKNQWTEDFKLLDWGPRGLFPEYLEMILQYGFITIFVAAFPLAPFFALLNNVLEMRLDAKKFLRFYRRPVPRRVKSIGIWFRILDILGRISVVTNAFIIAFSSNFIPRLVYMITVNKNHTDVGYLNHSLAYFNTSDYEDPKFNTTDYPLCRYQEYRNAPWEPHRYKRPPLYWHILAARLAFVVVFQNVVSIMMMAVQWLIPDTSRHLRDEMRKEAYLTSEIIISQERKRAQAMHGKVDSGDFLKGERSGLTNNSAVHRRKPGTSPEEIGLTEFHVDFH
ncbi:hypothetical protein C0J52_15186 [Blattella germanica]|nr:hypothetical protein C0J52_15186 [Blattella germanica]